jgi:cytochrome c
MQRRTAFALALGLSAGMGLAGAAAQRTVEDDEGRSEVIHEIGRFHPAPGAQVTHDYCTACHSEMIIIQQGQTRENWEEILVWMVEEMGMAELPEDVRARILDYLGTHYSPDRPHFPPD